MKNVNNSSIASLFYALATIDSVSASYFNNDFTGIPFSPIILGGIGVIWNGMKFTADLGDLGGGFVAFYYILTLAAVVSNGMFVYAGVLLFQYRKSGVWWGFGAVGIQVLSTLIVSLVIASALSDLDEGLGEAMAAFGIIGAAMQGICCSAIVALPLLMNGADLE